MSFTHLHLHTEYSLLDGACRIPKLVERIKALGMTSCAITDHGVMYGCIDFYSAMKDAGIKPIIGCEVYVCRDRLDKSAANREYSHLILLCENNTGYQNLMKLVSEGFLTGYYYRPRIDYNLIRQHSEGLIWAYTVGCAIALKKGVKSAAEAAAARALRRRGSVCARNAGYFRREELLC